MNKKLNKFYICIVVLETIPALCPNPRMQHCKYDLVYWHKHTIYNYSIPISP